MILIPYHVLQTRPVNSVCIGGLELTRLPMLASNRRVKLCNWTRVWTIYVAKLNVESVVKSALLHHRLSRRQPLKVNVHLYRTVLTVYNSFELCHTYSYKTGHWFNSLCFVDNRSLISLRIHQNQYLLADKISREGHFLAYIIATAISTACVIGMVVVIVIRKCKRYVKRQ